MFKSRSALFFALIAGAGILGATASASANYRHGGCCGPIPPTVTSSVVNKVSHVTHYRDVWHKNYVQRTHVYEHITEIRPIVYVHNVTRVHDKTVAVVHPVHVSRTEYLPVTEVASYSTVHINEGCCCR